MDLNKFKKAELVSALQWVLDHAEGMEADCERAEVEVSLDESKEALVRLYRKVAKTLKNGVDRSLKKEI